VFQRYLIVYLIIVTFVSLVVLLPINTSSDNYINNNQTSFSKTTITNVNPNSNLLWAHTIISWIFMILGYFIICIFSQGTSYDEEEYCCRTVLIRNFPKKFCKKSYIIKHFEYVFFNSLILIRC
jgi:calcium permeable stress-gated cation channel